MKVSVNAGHSDTDCGAVGQNGLTEEEVNVKISNLVIKYLQNCGIETLYIHNDDLQEICNESNNFESDLFVSIHCNSATNTEAKGTETFYGSDENFATCIQNQIINSLKTVDRGIKDGNRLYVIRNTNCKAILVECEFISNIEGECMLSDLNKQDEFARSIARGITDYINML